MGYVNDQDRFCSTPKLPLFSYRAYETPGLATPPVNIAGSVPFQWEEAPGKPRSSVGKPPRSTHNGGNRGIVRCLDLPPRLLLPHEPSPTTVLDGPYDLRRRSLSLPRSAAVIRKLRGVPAPAKEERLFGSSRWGSVEKCEETYDGVCDCRRDWAGGGSEFGGDGGTKVKLYRILKRKGSLFNLSHTKSDFWAKVYEGFKQVIPWRRNQQHSSKP